MLYGDAWKSLLESRSVVLTYIVSVMIFSFCYNFVIHEMETRLDPESSDANQVETSAADTDQETEDDPSETEASADETPTDTSPWKGLLSIVASVLNAGVTAALQAIFFARIGMRIDRPFWRCAGPKDALQRFFMPWFILNLGMLALLQVAGRFGNTSSALFFFLLFMMGFILMVPLGACIMYHGRLHWPEVPIALQPLARQFALSMAVMAICFFEFMLLLIFFDLAFKYEILRTSASINALINAPFALIECFIFAAMWRVCMIHRDSLSDEDPYIDL